MAEKGRENLASGIGHLCIHTHKEYLSVSNRGEALTPTSGATANRRRCLSDGERVEGHTGMESYGIITHGTRSGCEVV